MAFLLTDIEGSTRLWQQHPDVMRKVIARHDQILREVIAHHGGRVLTDHGEGDSFFAVFGRASDALACSRDLQLALHAEKWPEETPIRVRMSVNAGEAGGDYRGMAANRSARVRQLALGGQILISQSTYALVRDALPKGVTLTDLGVHELRDVSDREHVFRANIAGIPEPAPAATTAPPRRRPRWLAVTVPGLAAMVVIGLVVTALIKGQPASAPITAAQKPRASPAVSGVPTYVIKTVAGNGAAGYLPGPHATDAELKDPSGLAVDAAGDLFIADTGNDRVRELKPDGSLIDVVGGGDQASATGEVGTDLRLDRPTGLFMGSDGDLYIADTGDNRVVRMDPELNVFLVAGTGRAANGPQDGPATSSDLNQPTSAVYGLLNGNTADGRPNVGAFIADSGDGTFRWVLDGTLGDPVFYKGNAVRAPVPTFQKGDAVGMWYTGSLILYYADPSSNQVWRAVNEGGFNAEVSFVGTGTAGDAGDGRRADEAELNRPDDVAVDAAGRLFICDTGNNVVRMVDPNTEKIWTVAGNRAQGYGGEGQRALDAEFNAPVAVAPGPGGVIYIADSGNSVVRELVPAT